jgi:hypothetical protein
MKDVIADKARERRHEPRPRTTEPSEPLSAHFGSFRSFRRRLSSTGRRRAKRSPISARGRRVSVVHIPSHSLG